MRKGHETKSHYLVDSEHLTVALLNFLQLPQKIPKTAGKGKTELVKKRYNTIQTNAIKEKDEKTHQNLDLARTSLVAHSFIR